MPKSKAEIQRDYAKRSDYAAQKRYYAKHGCSVTIKFFRPQDDDILNTLNACGNKSGYIKNLIRENISK